MDLTEGSETSAKINQTLEPLKMDLTEVSETSANINQTPENHPKVDILKDVT
jgi:NADP-dependent 3-hydroxy acid dehydrogenase YdfG